MADIISQILDIDKNAREKVARAKEEKKQMLLDAEEERDKIKSQLVERAAHRLEVIEAQEAQRANEIEEELKASADEKIKTIDDRFEQNHEAWEKEIFERITK